MEILGHVLSFLASVLGLTFKALLNHAADLSDLNRVCSCSCFPTIHFEDGILTICCRFRRLVCSDNTSDNSVVAEEIVAAVTTDW